MLDEPMTMDASTPPDDDDSIASTVPSYFQADDEPGRRLQAGWAGRRLGLSDEFFARFLRIPESSLRDWRLGQAELPADRLEVLREFWWVVLLLLDVGHMDEQQSRGLLERRMTVDEASHPHPLDPPWIGSTMKSFLEEGGPDALPAVNRWLGHFRSGGAMFF